MPNNWSLSRLSPAITSVLILSLFLLQQGCITLPREPWSPPLTEDTRRSILTVGIMVSEELPRVTIDLPSKGAASGAGRKAGKWSGNFGRAVGGLLQVYGIPIQLAVNPLIAGIGALYGAVEAPSTETVESQERQVQAAIQAQAERLIADFERQIVGHITSQTDVVPTLLPRTEITQAGMEIPQGKTDTKPKGEAQLRIVLKSLELRGPYDVDPPLALQLEADITLSRYGTALYSRRFRYETERRHLTKWLVDDATPLREAVGTSLSRLAELIVDDMFLTYSFNHDHPWRNPS